MDVLEFANKVKAANDIVDVIGSYLELRRSGSNFTARCPFHGEKTASFVVSKNLLIFKCFGCGESGDVVKFLMKYESMTWWEAVEFLAKRAGIPIPERDGYNADEAAEKKRRRDLYLKICRETAVFYYKSLRSHSARKPLTTCTSAVSLTKQCANSASATPPGAKDTAAMSPLWHTLPSVVSNLTIA